MGRDGRCPHPEPFGEPFGKAQAKALRMSCAADRAALAQSSVETLSTSAATDGRGDPGITCSLSVMN